MGDTCDVIIIGAGAAGLAAARDLTRAGVAVQVLEARPRAGGRVLTHRDDRCPVAIELGAEFIHGAAGSTRALLEEARLAWYDADGEQWQARNGEIKRAERFFERVGRVMGRLDESEADRTFAEFLESSPGGRQYAQDKFYAQRFVQSFHGADVSIIGAKSLAQQGDPSDDETIEKTARPIGGYGPLIGHMLRDVAHVVRFEHVVERVQWSRGQVRVTVRDGRSTQVLEAGAAVITLPIGVLQAPPGAEGAVLFDPDPCAWRRAIDRMHPGAVLRVPLLFEERFWESRALSGLPEGKTLEKSMFINTPGGRFTIWWTQHPVRAPLLTAWTGGPPADELMALGRDGVIDAALEELSGALGVSRRRIQDQFVDGWTHDWSSDPYTRGAYAYARVGGARAPQALAKPIDDTLYMAGEAVASKVANGTVEGALAAGQQAARQYLARANR
jgi:monoamine oxidase